MKCCYTDDLKESADCPSPSEPSLTPLAAPQPVGAGGRVGVGRLPSCLNALRSPLRSLPLLPLSHLSVLSPPSPSSSSSASSLPLRPVDVPAGGPSGEMSVPQHKGSEQELQEQGPEPDASGSERDLRVQAQAQQAGSEQDLQSQTKKQHAGSERDLQSACSSVSLPSIRKTPKKRRLSLRALFRRRQRDPKRKSRASAPGGAADPLAGGELVAAESGLQDAALAGEASGASSSLSSSSAGGQELLECPLCLLRHTRERFPDIMTCPHRSCADCLRQYLRIEISESRVNITCPECSERFNPHDIRTILADRALMDKYEEFMLRRWLAADPDCRWCPAPDCGYAVIAFGCASCPKLTCGRDGCGTEFCYHCKQLWHPNQTCDAARQQRAQSLRLRPFRSSSLSYSQESGAAADDIKPCPRCAAYIIKMNDGSCNHMTCAVCGCEFCWLCMKEISDLHYLSPSGCTFWGKKPWSRKKKILWQLGTLVGAPVGIALIAGIAIPAMIIGIPVYVGRKIHNRYEGKDISKHKRNLVIAGGVTLSVIVSPVVAAVTVGIGVPIMLAYVYGVVPISLCRSGGCGVSAGNGKGVRIEFDDENDMNVGSGAVATDTTSVAETRHNPSLGEGSVGGLTGSLSASGSHMERIGAMRDNLSENASTMALAGASITGSLSGSTVGNCFNRLEVQADVQKERCSLSGESGTVSLGTISDNASTKAMAGSILNAYMPLDRDGSSLEVQVDVESKLCKLRHHSGSSSLDDSSGGGSRGGATGGGGCCSAGCPHASSSSSSRLAKESSSSSGGKKSKGKLRKRSSSGGVRRSATGSGVAAVAAAASRAGDDLDAHLLEQRSVHSSEPDSPSPPSLSGSLPSVADSHSSHFSEFSGGSDLDACRPVCCAYHQHEHAGCPRLPHSAPAVSPPPELEHGTPETSLLSGGTATAVPPSPQGAVLALRYIAEESVGLMRAVELDSRMEEAEADGEGVDASLKGHNDNLPPSPASSPRHPCIQTDI
ncbi:E3 ubiquitin-protein ligase RNF19A isoform X2 [Alosa sapidissima]|uniref:E3 ubiquitin-protein ligase RNF19A isoform X2 n=1 Tax=Alosa sapidissima TaxID=34773 RepID=UPI001C0808CD|nr:E3 ubiquitin-protein ligase RNF19A isoform X2 [Alosa sapidissima]